MSECFAIDFKKESPLIFNFSGLSFLSKVER